MHSFGLTPRWLVLAEFPFVVNPPSLAFQRTPVHRTPLQARARDALSPVRPLDGEVTGPFGTAARFGFHHVDSYEDGDEVVVDICTYPDPGVVEDLYLERLREGKQVQRAYLERFRITPGTGALTSERMLDESLELPRINYMRCNERPYRYVWGVGSRSGWLDQIVKGDLGERSATVWSEDGCFPGEPVFVSRPGADDEDDGVLLSVVLDGRTERSFLLVLDAGSLDELARAEVSHHIPFGFHGQFAR